MAELGHLFGSGNAQRNKRSKASRTEQRHTHRHLRSPHRPQTRGSSGSRNRRSADQDDDKALAEQIASWNRKRLENKMIVWKGKNPGKSFVDFCIDKIPENVEVDQDGSVSWTDPRLKGSLWQGAFDRVQASDPLNEIGEAPS